MTLYPWVLAESALAGRVVPGWLHALHIVGVHPIGAEVMQLVGSGYLAASGLFEYHS